MKRLYIPALIAIALAAPAIAVVAEATSSGTWLPASGVATHLAENGFRVLKLERESEGFTAELVDRQGGLVKARINPSTGAITSSKSDGRAGAQDDQWLTLTQVARRLEGQGYLVRKIAQDTTAYEAELTDRAGARADAIIDPRSGEILSQKPD